MQEGRSLQYFSGGIGLYQRLALMDLNGDAFPDAVAVDTTGQLHLILNRSAAVDVQITAAGARRVEPGTSAFEAFTAMTVTVKNFGTENTQTSCGPASINLRFRRSLIVFGVETPGTPLTQAEVSALVKAVIVRKCDNGFVGGNIYAAPTGVTNGYYTYALADEAIITIPGAPTSSTCGSHLMPPLPARPSPASLSNTRPTAPGLAEVSMGPPLCPCASPAPPRCSAPSSTSLP